MKKAFKYRLYPNKTQQAQMEKSFGCVRFVWNQMVAAFNSSQDAKVEESKLLPLKKQHAFLYEVSNTILQQKLRDWFEFKNQFFSKSRKSKINKPSFKKRGKKDSFRLSNTTFRFENNKIRLEKIGHVRIVIDRPIPTGAKLFSATVSKNASGQYFVSIVAEVEISPKMKTGKRAGIDLGLKSFLVTSDNQEIKSPKFFRESQAELARAQKWFAKKKKGSRRRRKCGLKVARIHQRISNQRAHFLHQITNNLVSEYDQIVIEDLNVAGMKKNRSLAKSISDASFSMFRQQLTYKCLWYGKELVVADRWYASSKTCSCCGNKKEKLGLGERTYNCEACGLNLDRDFNAALNLKQYQTVGINAVSRSSRANKSTASVAARLDETSRFQIN